MIGQTVSHYKILEKLGGGGMGVVYKAQDLKLDRPVALKFLPPDLTRDPEAKQRFVHEAKAASALDHQNICNVHDIGETDDGQIFIVMAFYEGETLKKKIERGPLQIDDALTIAIQVAQGLNKSHEHGIAHRDVKPANIMVTSDGVAKIVDFGLAKLSGRTMLTRAGSTLGTAAYMSPEQARGEPTDHRTDIWSLGVVLYEMITGKRPFEADYENALLYSILNSEPAPVTALRTGIPMELERILFKCLAKLPGNRYQHVDEMLVDLNQVRKGEHTATAASFAGNSPAATRSRVSIRAGVLLLLLISIVGYLFWTRIFRGSSVSDREKSIAVLPFLTPGNTEEDRVFADGIQGEILTCLTRIKEIKVKGQTGVMQYRATRKSMRVIGQELGVSYLMEGSAQKAGDRIRIQAQLIDVQTEDHVWAHTYAKPYGDIFAIQADIAENIASELRATLAPQEKSLLDRRPTNNTEAYDLYLMAYRISTNSQSLEEDNRAVEFLKKVVALDPNFVLAWARLSIVQCEMMQREQVRSPERVTQARIALERAEARDPALPEVHQAKGTYYLFAEPDSSRAFTELALALNDQPGNSGLLLYLGAMLSNQGYEREGLEYNLKAYELDPTSLTAAFVAWGYLSLRRFDEAERMGDVQIAYEPRNWGQYSWKFRTNLFGRGDIARARVVLEETRRNTHERLVGWEISIDLYAREYAAALSIAESDSTTDPLLKSYICRLIGQHENARAHAVRAAGRYSGLVQLQPDWEPNHLSLARALVFLGRRDEALREAGKALHSGLRFAPNPGKSFEIQVMQVHILLGDYNKAISEIEQLLSVPSMLTNAQLRLDPIYDPLRSNPRFRALLARQEQM
jgi:eukaryotic-like serine/threonine-protein kinase